MHFVVLMICVTFALAGGAMLVRGSQRGWELVLLGVVPGTIAVCDLLLSRIRASQEYGYEVELTSNEVICRRSDGEFESVSWSDLKAVSAYGAHLEGYTLLLNGMASGCAVPDGAVGIDKLLKRMNSLPGFDFEAITAAAMSENREEHLCWERERSSDRTEALSADSR
jgi:hypothetical protein